MKNFLVAIFMLAMVATLKAETLTTALHDIISPEGMTKHFTVLAFNNGRVLKLSPRDLELRTQLEQALSEGRDVRVKLGFKDFIKSVEVLGVSQDTTEFEMLKDGSGLGSFQLTNVNSSYANSLFGSLKTNSKKWSQCYQRAMVWASDMWSNNGIKSGKIFIFFTRRYISAYEYKWWFHVAPYISVDGVEKVMDRSFTSGPTSVGNWTPKFMKNGATCPVISNYAQYSNNEYSHYCYLRKVPMYHYQPADVQQADAYGSLRTSFNHGDIGAARKAFWGWRGTWAE